MKKTTNIPKIDELPDIFDLVLAGLLTGYTADYLRKMSIAGKFPGFQMFPDEKKGEWRVKKEDFLAWLDEKSAASKWKGSEAV